MEKEIWFDLDGTLAGLYNYPQWKELINDSNSEPYLKAKPLLNLSQLAKLIHRVQAIGYTVGIISWSSRNSTKEFHDEVNKTKREWLNKHLPSVIFDAIYVVPYGTPKHSVGKGILFDDNAKVRAEWGEGAYAEQEIITVLKTLGDDNNE